MRLSTAREPCLRPFSRWSSARSATPCVRDPGIESSVKLSWCVSFITSSVPSNS